MNPVNMRDAKSQLSRLVKAIESKQIDEIVITRNGQPVAKLVQLKASTDISARIGVAKNKLLIPDELDGSNKDIKNLFLERGI